MGFLKLNKILHKSLKKNGISQQITTADFMEQLKEAGELIFGKENMKKIKFMGCEDGTLMITCLSSVLAKELKSKEKEILGKLNGFYGRRVVSRLKFIV